MVSLAYFDWVSPRLFPTCLLLGSTLHTRLPWVHMTEWVRVPVDTDSMSTINTVTFRGIGTQSSSITDRNDNEDYNPNFRKLKSK